MSRDYINGGINMAQSTPFLSSLECPRLHLFAIARVTILCSAQTSSYSKCCFTFALQDPPVLCFTPMYLSFRENMLDGHQCLNVPYLPVPVSWR